MSRPPTLTLAALLLLPMLLLVPSAHAAVEDAERTIVFTTPDNATAWFNGTLRGDEAHQIRIFMDADSDGNITEAEAANLSMRMMQAGNEHKAWPATMLDGVPHMNVSIVDLEVHNAVGPTNASRPLQVDRVLQFQYAPDMRADNHTWLLRVDEPARLTQWDIHAPPGYVVADAQGLRDLQLSENASRVSGATNATTLTIVMQDAETAAAGAADGANAGGGNATGDARADATPGDAAGDDAAADGDTPPPQDAQPEEAAEDNDLPAPGLLGVVATLAAVALGLSLRARTRR